MVSRNALEPSWQMTWPLPLSHKITKKSLPQSKKEIGCLRAFVANYLAFATKSKITKKALPRSRKEIMGLREDGILQSEYLAQEWDFPGNLVLFAGSGHAWLGFNYEERDIPNVVYVEPDDGDGNNFHVIAETFAEFISKLDDPDKYID